MTNMIIDSITNDNVHMIPQKMRVDKIGKIQISYCDSQFKTRIEKDKTSSSFCFPTSKPQSIDEFNSSRYGYMVTENGVYVGHAIIEIRFNNSIYIEDFDISPEYRKTGVASKLMKFIELEAMKNNKCVSLEVQNNNVIAFWFYLKEGFEIGGFDNLFYKNTVQKDETAIYMYKFFDNGKELQHDN